MLTENDIFVDDGCPNRDSNNCVNSTITSSYHKSEHSTKSTATNRGLKDPPILKRLKRLRRAKKLTEAIALLESCGIKSWEVQLLVLDGMGGGDE